MYSVFTNNVPLAVRFATVAIGMRKAESPKYRITQLGEVTEARVPRKLKTPRIWPTIFWGVAQNHVQKYVEKAIISEVLKWQDGGTPENI